MWPFRKKPVGTIIPMLGYHQFFTQLARKLGTTNIDLIYSKHEAFCAKCNTQFTREALGYLDLYSSGLFGGSVISVRGATREGADLRSGRCPYCGHTDLRIVTSD